MKYPLLALVLLTFSSATAATQPSSALCETTSPGLHALGNKYYNADQGKSVGLEKASALNLFYARLAGKWSGEQTDSYCVGGGKTRQKHYIFKDALAQIEPNGLLSIVSERQAIRRYQGSKRTDVMSYKPNYRLEFNPAGTLFDLALIDPDTIAITTLYRQRVHIPNLEYIEPEEDVVVIEDSHTDLPIDDVTDDEVLGNDEFLIRSKYRERRDTMKLKGNTLSIETLWYHNGYYSGTEVSTFTRR